MHIDISDWPVTELAETRQADLKRELLVNLVNATHRHRHRRNLTLAAAATAVVCAGASLVVWSPQPASAAWSAIPAPLALGLDDPMVKQCLSDLPVGPAKQVGQASLTQRVAEQRGTSQAVLLAGDDSEAVCILTPTSRTGGRTLAPTLELGQDMLLAGDGGSSDGAGSRYVYGRVSPKVASVAITTTTGLSVTSSVHDGAFLAWWPGGSAPATITAKDARSVVVTTMEPSSQ